MFRIQITDKKVEGLESGDSAVYGNIAIGTFHEEFYVSTTYWSQSDYISQWIETLQEMVGPRENSKGALISDMYDPAYANFLRCWTLFREGKIIYIHEQIIFLGEIPEEFNIQHIDQYIGNRETETDNGEKTSEWITDAGSIKECLNDLKAKQ